MLALQSKWQQLYEDAIEAFGHTYVPPRAPHNPIRRCRKALQVGSVSKAAQALLQVNPPAEHTTPNANALQSLHPPPNRSVQRVPKGSLPAPYVFTEAEVRKELRCFPFHSSPGPDGLRPSHIKSLPHAPGGVEPSRSTLAEFTTFINKMANGDLPISQSPQVARGLLLGIPKPHSSSLRPIAIGTVIRRLVGRLLMNAILQDNATDIRSYLLPYQLAVGTKGATEAIVHATRSALRMLSHEEVVVLFIDAKNAFNAIERATILEQVIARTPGIARWVHYAYGEPSVLQFGTNHILSMTGTQQGDPLSMLLFALALQPLLHQVSRAFPHLCFNVFYADDGTIIARVEHALSVLEFLRHHGSKCGFHINVKKTKIWCPRPLNTRLFQHDIFQYHVTQQPVVMLLGAPIGDTDESIQAIMDRAQEVQVLWRRLPLLRDPQSAYHILRVCASACRMVYALRCTSSHITSPASQWFDAGMRRVFEVIHRPQTDTAWMFASLSIRMGGLDLLNTRHMYQAAYIASVVNNAVLIQRLLHPRTLDIRRAISPALLTLHENYNLPLSLLPTSLIQRAERRCIPDNLQAELASIINNGLAKRAYPPMSDGSERARRIHTRIRSVETTNSSRVITTLPCSLKGTRVEPEVWTTIIDKRLGNLIYSVTTACNRCALNNRISILDPSGHHAAICGAREGTIARHNGLRDKLYSILAMPMYGLKIDREWFFPQDLHRPIEDRRRMDIMIDDRSFAPRPQAFDITVITPHARNNMFASLDAVFSAAERRKTRAYQHLCDELGVDLHTIALDIYGAVSKNAERALQMVANFIAKKRGSDPVDERRQILTSLSIWVNVETAVAINRRMLDDRTPS